MVQRHLGALLLATTLVVHPLPAAAQVPPIQPPPGVQASSSTTFANLTITGNLTVGGQFLPSGTINGITGAVHPNGGGYFDELLTDAVGLVSGDCTTVPVHIDISGTATTGDVAVGFTYNDGAGHSTTVTTTPTTGESNAQIAAALSTHFKANTTIATIFSGKCPDGIAVSKIVTNAVAIGSTFYFNQFWPEQGTATTIAINSAHTTITVSQGDARLENNPYLSLGRHVAGRAPVAGDLIGALYPGIGDDSVSYATGGLNVQYGDLFVRIADPLASAPVGNLQLVEASGTGIGLQATGTGITGGAYLYGTGGAVPTGGFMGNGTWNVAGGYYLGGASGFALTGGNPSLGIGTAPNAAIPLDLLAASSSGQARFRYGGGSGLLINQIASGGKIYVVNQAASTLSLASSNGADNLTINSAGHVSVGRDNSSDQGGNELEVYGSGGLSLRYDSGQGFILQQGGSGGPMYLWNQANNPMYLGANNATVMTLLAGGQIGSPTGGDEGAGSLNLAGDVYKNGVSLTATAVAGQKALQATKTSNYSVLAGDSNTSFDNTGAGGTVIFTLPSYTAGLQYCFTVTAAHALEVLAPASNHIAVGTSNSASAGNIQASAVYSTACIVATSVSNQWAATSTTGSWTVN
jgi:hypothetical protein